jgi:hypothetical protein
MRAAGAQEVYELFGVSVTPKLYLGLGKQISYCRKLKEVPALLEELVCQLF